jgi:Gti1/Pac2 family transcription factor
MQYPCGEKIYVIGIAPPPSGPPHSATKHSAQVPHGFPNRGDQFTATAPVDPKPLPFVAGGFGGAQSARGMETYYGHVPYPADAILLFEACRLNVLPRVHRRLSEKERRSIRSGSVFVWDEGEAGFRRWTDGKSWSASRVSAGSTFLTYREMEGIRRSGLARSEGDGEDNVEDEVVRYDYKPDGLMKQSFKITTSTRQKLQLISYYSHSQHPSGLVPPTLDIHLKHIHPPKGMYPDATSVEHAALLAQGPRAVPHQYSAPANHHQGK